MSQCARAAWPVSMLLGMTTVLAQAGPTPSQSPEPVVYPAPPPATALEAFNPVGSVVTVGYNELGRVQTSNGSVRVEVRDMREASGATARGVVVDVTEGQTRRDRSFVDADELPGLLNGLDALLEARANPTSFERFQLQYATRGELVVTAVGGARGTVTYVMAAGRTVRAEASLELADLVKLRGLFEAALAKLNAPNQ